MKVKKSMNCWEKNYGKKKRSQDKNRNKIVIKKMN